MTREVICILNNMDILYGRLNRMAREGDADMVTTAIRLLSLDVELVQLTMNRRFAINLYDSSMPDRFLCGRVTAVWGSHFTIVTDGGSCVDVPFNRVCDMAVVEGR